MKKICLLFTTILLMAVLAGCGNSAQNYDKNTLIINKNGSIVEVAVEDFQDSSVKEDEIESYIEGQISAYRESSGKKVSKKSIDADDMGQVRLVLNYEDMESYNGFNSLNDTLQDYESLSESELKGSYTSASGESVKVADFGDMKNAKVLMVDDATDIVIDGEILYYNEEISLNDKVATATGNSTAVIIYK